MRFMVLALGMFIVLATGASARGVDDQAIPQPAMPQPMQRHPVEGAILRCDSGSGDVRALHPTRAHPMVGALSGHCILCADPDDQAGNALPPDLSLASTGRSLVVFPAGIGDRAPQKKLIDRGLAELLR
jgi:hypothetical protein